MELIRLIGLNGLNGSYGSMRTGLFVFVILTVLLSACSVASRTSEGLYRLDSRLSVQAGGGYGGIVENTHMTIVENAPIDAFSGATALGWQAGMHYLFPLGMHSGETGLDVFRNAQEFRYNDPVNFYTGQRYLKTWQIRLPLTYTWSLYRKYRRSGWLQVRTGLSAGYTFLQVEDSNADLPPYTVKPFTIGPLLGCTLQPFHFKGNAALGFNVEVFRSFLPTYEDYYNIGEMPSLSYFRFGVSYTLPVSGLLRKYR